MQKTQIQSLDQEDTPGEGNGYLLQYSYLEKPMDRGAWWVMVHGPQRFQHNWTTNTSLQLFL